MILAVFAICLTLSAAVECAVMALLFRRRDCVYYTLLANLLTNPALNLLLLLAVHLMGRTAYYTALAPLEIAVVLAEAFIFKLLCGFKPVKALWISALINAVSFAAGILLQTVFDFSAMLT